MSAFSDVRKMLIASQVQYADDSEIKILKLECCWKKMVDT